MNLLEVLDVDLIDLEMDVSSKDEAIRALAGMLDKKGNINDLDGFIDAVYERESIGETGMGNAIAIPHGLTNCVSKASVAIGKTKAPIEWESLDDQPVRLVFLLAMPNDNLQNTHLCMLAQLAAVLAYKEHIDSLMDCKTKEEFFNLFKSYFDERVNQ